MTSSEVRREIFIELCARECHTPCILRLRERIIHQLNQRELRQLLRMIHSTDCHDLLLLQEAVIFHILVDPPLYLPVKI